MAIPLFLAMTQMELRYTAPLPPKAAWMACHFSPYGTGLTDLPDGLPKGSLLILDDRIPEHGHDPALIAEQLGSTVKRLGCAGLLLDLQQEPSRNARTIVAQLVRSLPCPVAVPPPYAEALDCPVFLPPIPPHILPEDHLSPWTGREIWLEASMETVRLTISPNGCTCSPLPGEDPPCPHCDPSLHCHYAIHQENDDLWFTLTRTWQDLCELLEALHPLGVTTAVGLYQELSRWI